jgi:hypothetical protein
VKKVIIEEEEEVVLFIVEQFDRFVLFIRQFSNSFWEDIIGRRIIGES